MGGLSASTRNSSRFWSAIAALPPSVDVFMDSVPDDDGCRGDFPDPQGSRGAGAELDATNYILRCGPPLRPPLVPLSRRLAPAPSRGSRRGSAAPRRKASRGAV